jgi:antitoxin (DNA-binding transcriptional repressor) of toxin-antitoxin stability system
MNAQAGTTHVPIVDGEIPGELCHNVHMKTITIRELHMRTGRWVRHAAANGPVTVTDRGRRIATLRPAEEVRVGRPLPDREAKILKQSRIPVDSTEYVSEMRERG